MNRKPINWHEPVIPSGSAGLKTSLVVCLAMACLMAFAPAVGAQEQDPDDIGIQDSIVLGYYFYTHDYPSEITCENPNPMVTPGAALWLRTDDTLSAIEFRLEIYSVDSGQAQVDSFYHWGVDPPYDWVLEQHTETYVSDGVLPDTVVIKRWTDNPNKWLTMMPYESNSAWSASKLIFQCLGTGRIGIRNLGDGTDPSQGTRFWPGGVDPDGDDYFLVAFPPWEYDLVEGESPIVDDPGATDFVTLQGVSIPYQTSVPLTVSLTNDEYLDHINFRIGMTTLGTSHPRLDSVVAVGRATDYAVVPYVSSYRWDSEPWNQDTIRVGLSVASSYPTRGNPLPPGSGPIVQLFFSGTVPGGSGQVEFESIHPYWQQLYPTDYPLGDDYYFFNTALPSLTVAVGDGTIVDPDAGIRDTVRFEAAEMKVNESRPIAVSVYNDNDLDFLGLNVEINDIDGGFLRFDSAVWTGRLADPSILDIRSANANYTDGYTPDIIQIAAVGLLSDPLPPGDDVVVRLYFTGVSAGSALLDSALLSTNMIESEFGLSAPGSDVIYRPEFQAATVNVVEGDPYSVVTFSPAPEVNQRYALSDAIGFYVEAGSSIGNPVEVTLSSFERYDAGTPAVAEPTFGGNPGWFAWAPGPDDIGIWRATFAAVDLVDDSSATVEVCLQVVSDDRYLLSLATETGAPAVEWSILDGGLAHGDFDGDEASEVAVSYYYTEPPISVSIYDYEANVAAPDFDEVWSGYFGTTLWSRGVVAGYFNGDHRLDLALCVGHDLRVLLGNGDNTFSDVGSPAWVPAPHQHVATLTNFNGDAHLDYALADDHQVLIYLGTPGARFVDGYTLSLVPPPGSELSGVWTLNSADFDGDGWDDLAVSTTAGLEIHLNDQLGGYALAYTYTQEYAPVDISITNEGTDFDQNGTYDLCLAAPLAGDPWNAATSRVMVYYGNGDGSFELSSVRSVVGTACYSRTGDFNRDGYLDIAFINNTEAYLAIVFGDAEGAFVNEVRYPMPEPSNPYLMDAMDIDDDGDLDIVVSARVASTAVENNYHFLFLNQTDPAGLASGGLRVSVLNNADLEVVAPTGGRLSSISNGIVSGAYYRRQIDDNERIDASAAVGAVESGRYDLVVKPRPNLSPTETFSLAYTDANNVTWQIARNLPASETGYTFPVFTGMESPIMPMQGMCIRALRPVFDWRSLWTGDLPDRQGSMPVPDLQAEFQLASDPGFENMVETAIVDGGRYTFSSILAVSDTTSYFWRVRPVNATEWDHVFVFHALPASDLPKDPADTDTNSDPGDTGDTSGETADVDDVVEGHELAVKGEEVSIPEQFDLSQNYPNPFNPTTEIGLALPTGVHVELEIFNIVGQKVATLAEGYLEAGYHTIVWDGRGAASGIYFYRLVAGDYVATRKMVLLK